MLRLMAQMGISFEENVSKCYPEFELRREPLHWEDYLPQLSPSLRQLMESYPCEEQTTKHIGSRASLARKSDV
jgi:hypothetical protein